MPCETKVVKSEYNHSIGDDKCKAEVGMNIFKAGAYKLNKYPKCEVTVIIAAGGSGSRMGGISKPLMELCGKRVIEYSLEAFSACPAVGRIFISAKGDDLPIYNEIVKKGKYPKLFGVVKGGDTRAESVSNAFIHAMKDGQTDFVAIHDGARPLITTHEIESAVKTAAKYGSGVCAVRVRDTVKRASKGLRVTDSVERDGLFLISTPQVFSTDIYHTSLSVARKNAAAEGASVIDFTDDSSMVSEAGFEIMLCESSSQNIKITYPDDIVIAEAILGTRTKSTQG